MLADLILTLALLAIDQITKCWAVHVLAALPNGAVPVVEGVFHLVYAENTGENVSFLRGRSAVMLIVRVLQVALAVYLLVRQRKKLAPITRAALCFFLAGLIGNQLNYLLFDFVPDMIYLPFLGTVIFNVADVWVLFAMVVLFVRLAFFEGRDLADWLSAKLSRKKAPAGENAGKAENGLPENAHSSGEDHVAGK